jgi:light-regulated signal transduction histidine kinase (bacteriophytochrome)
LNIYSPKRIPVIHLRTDCIDRKEVLMVSGNGLGKHCHKIFGLRKTFHRHAEAKGLGLFITKTQIEAMGGSINVESEENKGSTFKIIFNQQT